MGGDLQTLKLLIHTIPSLLESKRAGRHHVSSMPPARCQLGTGHAPCRCFSAGSLYSVGRWRRFWKTNQQPAGVRSAPGRRAQNELISLYVPLIKAHFKRGLDNLCQAEKSLNIKGKNVSPGDQIAWVEILASPLLVKSYLTFRDLVSSQIK